MSEPNLTPKPFIQQVQKRVAMRRWVAPVALCAFAALVSIFLEISKPADTSGQLAEERVSQAKQRIESNQALLKSQSSKLVQKERELQAEQHLTLRPDWGAVLVIVAQQFDENLMLAGLQLDDMKNSRVRSALGPIAEDVPDDSAWLIISGLATANSDVSGLIMRLESLGLFERVVMTGTQRETFSGDARTTFTLACRVQ
ncbi:MAG: PilN domain-containing protein [Phycisphaeraceae bacterium]